MIDAVHGTVNGLVLVGLAEGVVLGAVYVGVGLPYSAPIAAIDRRTRGESHSARR